MKKINIIRNISIWADIQKDQDKYFGDGKMLRIIFWPKVNNEVVKVKLTEKEAIIIITKDYLDQYLSKEELENSNLIFEKIENIG